MTTERPNTTTNDGWPRRRARLIRLMRVCLWVGIASWIVAVAGAIAAGDHRYALLPAISGIAILIALILSHGLRQHPVGSEPATAPTEQEGAPQ